MAESCKLSAVTLALRSLTNNEELTRRLAWLAEESNVAYLYSDALKEDIIEGVSDANKLASEYTLKKESADIKFKAVLFGSLLANTKQWDEAIDMLMKEIWEQWWTAAEWLWLIDLMSRMDLSWMDEAARVVFNTTQEEATRIVEEMRTKISNYVWSEYSLVTSGSNIKAKKVVRQLNKELEDAVKVLDDAKADLWEGVFDDVDKDLNKINAVHKKWYWSTKEGKAEIKKIADKYWVPPTKWDVEKYLKKISDAKKTAAEQVDRVDEIIETYDAAVEWDLKLIENGQNPFNYIWADSEWKFIKGFNNDVSTRVQQYWQYMLARTLLTDNWEVPQRLYDMLVKTISAETKWWITNYIWEPLTEDWILSKDRTLDELMSRAYMNTAQLVKDWNLRMIYRQQLIALASDDMLSKADVEFIEDLINTMKFAEVWAGFSTVLKYNALVNRCKELWIDIKWKSGKWLWNSIKSFLTSDDFEKKLEAGDILTLGNWVQVTKRQLLELVVNMTWDLNVKKAVALNQWTDSSLIWVAAKYLMWDTVGWRKRLMDLIWAAKATATTDDIRWMILKSLTWKNVPIWTPVAFFDFRRWLKAEDDVKYRAKYMETLANANKINLPDNTIEDITTDAVNSLVSRLEKLRWWFVLVNDSQWKMNSVLCDALDIVNKWRKTEERVNILAPKWGLMWQVKRENWKLVFKTMYSDVFNNFLEDIALKTFWTSMADTKFTKNLLDRLAKWDLDAIAESNKILEQDAKEYYAQMLWVDVYSEDLIPMLEEMTGISFKSYDAIIDKAKFRKKVDDAFMLEWKVLWKYSQEVTTVSNVVNEINAMTTDQIAWDLSYRFGYTITKWELEADWVIKDEIKNAYINYKLAQTPLELLERKWRLIAKINWWTADNITTNQFRSMIQSKDFDAYKEIFFWSADMGDELLATMTRNINDMIFDNLWAELADRLVDMWYSLPLMNIRELVFDWVNWTLDTNNSFVRAFFAKNGLDPTMSTLNWILDQAMPTQLRFSYDWVVENLAQSSVKWDIYEWAKIWKEKSVPDYISRLIETPNEFQQDTYSSLISMAAIKDWARLSWGWNERDLLAKMLDDYYKAFEKAFEWWKEISFKEAQEIKTRMWYALDMFEQDYISPRYWQFLTPDERSETFWLKYALWVTTSKSWLKTIKEYNERVMNRFTDATSRVLWRADALSSNLSKTTKSVKEEIQKRQQQLIDQWATMKVVNWQAVVVDIRNEIRKQMNNLPSNIHWLDALKTLWRTWLNQLSNAEAYFILNLIELAKNAENRMNLITKTIYKVCPQLAKVDFFNTFKMVWELPEALQWNLLLWTKWLSKYENTTTFDIEVKKWIFSDIKDEFREGWQLTYDRLTKIINKNIDNNVNLLWWTVSWRELKTFKKEAAITYQWAFNLYTLLKDVPKEVKLEIDNILNQQRQWISEALDMLWDGNRLVDVMDEVSILCSDWTVKTFRQALEWENESISKILFNESSDVVKEADEAAIQTIDPSWSPRKQRAVKRENELTVEKTNNNYLEWLNAYLNWTEVISQAERDLINTTRTSARQIAKQYTLTNKLAETDNALASINEAIMRDFKINILGFLWNITQWWQNVRWIKWLSDNIITDVMAKWKEVQDRYRVLYNMSYEELMAYKSRAAKNSIDNMALNLALYFKEIERRLWSLDWLTWWTTSREVNMAFAHLWEVVWNIDSITSLFSLMSWVEWNQILKFFRFANPWDAARVNEFIIWWVWKQYLWGYRNFVDKTDEWLNLKWFNTTFGANLSDTEYRKLIQALCWFTITSWKMKWFEKALNFVNQSNYLFRTLVSYPGQMITIHPQNIWYWLRQLWHEESLWAEDLWTIDAIREPTGILNETYNEINLFRYASPDDTNPTSFYNRYWIPDVNWLMREEKLYTSDDLETMYSKIDKYWSKWAGYYYDKFIRNTDAYKDNFNNFIDWTFARNFKNIAFLKALQSNEYIKFATATQFAEFMAWEAPEYMKTKLMQAVAEASWRNFRNILWLGFSWLDRAIWWSAIRNVGIWLMQMFNFRWAWWQNIARQTWNWLSTSIKMARSWLSKEWRDAMALYIAKQPEFVNFTSQLFNDLKYSWFLTKYQDNWDWPVDWDDLNWIDFIQYWFETLQFSSQWWQGIQSYWLTRIISETAESAIQSARDPEIYKDTLGIWALMNAMSKNLWRNWKVPNLVVRTLAQNWTDAKRAYLQNEFWKLSYWSLRYLMNEDENGSWYNTELIKNRPWAIPFVISWEVSEDWDKAFSYDLANTETWLNIQNWFDAIDAWDWDAARAYFMNNLDSFFNASQMLWTVKNVGRALAWSSLIWDKTKDWLADDFHVYKFWSPFDLAEVWDAVDWTVAWHEFMKNWYYRPTDWADVKILVKEVMWQADYRPWNNWFNKSMFNFDEYWHMAWEKWASKDATMEFLLENIKYERDANFNFKVDDNWKRIVNKDWEIHMKEMARRNNDANYMTYANFNFINNRVEANNDDPNYMMYRRLIWEWLAWRYTTQAINDIMDEHNRKHWLKKTAKLTKEDLEKKWLFDVIYPQLVSRQTYITGENMDFLTSIMLLDKEAAMSANLKMIARQLAEKWEDAQIKKIFNFNEDWEITLWKKYEGYLKEQAKLWKALEEWDIEKFRAETASITRMYRDEDPYGIMTTVLVASRIKRINDADSLSAEQKAKAIDALFEDNYDFIQTHIPQLIDAIWSKSEALAYVEQMNESIYDTSYIWDKLVADNEMAGSKSWRSAAVRVSTRAKNLLWKLWSAAWWSSTSWSVWWWKKYNYNFVPVKLDWAKLLKATWGKWYTPITSSAAIKAYKAHADFSAPKDVNRKVKTTKTQTISSKKQLSNIETKTTKALEAES